MAQARLSVRKIREVLRLKAEARWSDRQIAAATGTARSTVQECLRRAKAAGVSWPLPPECDDEELTARLYPRASAIDRYPTPDRVLRHLPNILRGHFDSFELSRLISGSLTASLIVALIGMFHFARKDV